MVVSVGTFETSVLALVVCGEVLALVVGVVVVDVLVVVVDVLVVVVDVLVVVIGITKNKELCKITKFSYITFSKTLPVIVTFRYSLCLFVSEKTHQTYQKHVFWQR